MDYTTICEHLVARNILVIARGTIDAAPMLAMLSEGRDLCETGEFREQEQALFHAIAEKTIFLRLWCEALAHQTSLCVDPETHRLSWTWQDRGVCPACRQLRDVYFSQLAKLPATHTIDMRPAPEAKILEFKRKAVG